MFGYIIINKPEMKFKEFDLYQSYYCGLCRSLKKEYGRLGQMTLSYDMTFVILFLSSLYEPETLVSSGRCAAHPCKKHCQRINPFSAYGADMNLLLSYYKCLDDWEDEHKINRKIMALSLQRRFRKAAHKYPQKEQIIQEKMRQIHACEKQKCRDLDLASGYFGEIMAEIFVWRKDEWEKELRHMGFFWGNLFISWMLMRMQSRIRRQGIIMCSLRLMEKLVSLRRQRIY